jgi:hypothetical protein
LADARAARARAADGLARGRRGHRAAEPLGLEDVDLVVAHTLEEGTTITGNTRPWAEAIKGLGMAFKWFAPKRLWFRQQSRGRAAPSGPARARGGGAAQARSDGARRSEPAAIDEAEANEFRADLLRDRRVCGWSRARRRKRARRRGEARGGAGDRGA